MNLFCLLSHICVKWWAHFDNSGHNILFYHTLLTRQQDMQPACKDTLHSGFRYTHTHIHIYFFKNTIQFFPFDIFFFLMFGFCPPFMLSSFVFIHFFCVCVHTGAHACVLVWTVGTWCGWGKELLVIYSKAGRKMQPWAPDTTTHTLSHTRIHSPTVACLYTRQKKKKEKEKERIGRV